uniref:Uncharacterized protein n=1 Tax=Anguilla anguilla TaxID=7936 RepID=A0A0E9WUX1_ANGAN
MHSQCFVTHLKKLSSVIMLSTAILTGSKSTFKHALRIHWTSSLMRIHWTSSLMSHIMKDNPHGLAHILITTSYELIQCNMFYIIRRTLIELC